jgi:hypothetical protein
MTLTQSLTDTWDMPADESLKRLGGGRWETRDGRFAIEPQSGTWVVVDSTQTDDLGLPLVRGPFGSLTAAKEAIEGLRTSGPMASPLADRLKKATAAAPSRQAKAGGSRKQASASDVRPARTAPEPEPPPEPKWLRDLGPSDRRRARELIEKLEKLDVAEPEEIVRSEVARNRPAITRLAIERALARAIASSKSPAKATRAAISILVGGRDLELGVRWRLVDDQGRVVDEVDLPE